MATAAPSAPAAAPTVSQSASIPAASQIPTGTSAPAADAPIGAAPPKTVKPIKNTRPQLPGVFPDDDPFPSPPQSNADSPTPSGEGTDRQGRQRGSDGRFVAGASPANGDGEPTLEPGTDDNRDPSRPATTKFKFAGEEFDSQQAAEQNFKSLRGQYKPIQTLAMQLGGIDKVVPSYTRAAESARGWKAEHDRVKAELDALRANQPAGTQANGAQPPVPSAEGTEPADVDWELYAEVKRLATEQGEPWKAEQWLIEQVRKVERGRTDKLLAEKLAPLDAAQERQEAAAKVGVLVENLSAYVNPDGSPAYPELGDEQSAHEIGMLWHSLGLPPEVALTPQGMVAAIGLYRMIRGASASPSQAKPAPAVAAPTATAPAVPTDAVSAAELGNGKPTVASVSGNGGTPSAEAARILAGLRSARTNDRSMLGFES